MNIEPRYQHTCEGLIPDNRRALKTAIQRADLDELFDAHWSLRDSLKKGKNSSKLSCSAISFVGLLKRMGITYSEENAPSPELHKFMARAVDAFREAAKERGLSVFRSEIPDELKLYICFPAHEKQLKKTLKEEYLCYAAISPVTRYIQSEDSLAELLSGPEINRKAFINAVNSLVQSRREQNSKRGIHPLLGCCDLIEKSVRDAEYSQKILASSNAQQVDEDIDAASQKEALDLRFAEVMAKAESIRKLATGESQ
jgi:hypothetical protein